ncbi:MULTISPECIES: potassium channel family protein [Paenibacillus]|jgi:voltage-gated potassium channel|uniref:Ion transport 2 domain protein n=3 Tax=Bacillati TaxID=1783272 RepID=G4HLJ1_9BACL|nr:potassium channel family protein [Paenibacillus lactis]EHB56917.1 Ion transport 2 domain protein [Paenibacillus lactis 154]MBP1892563.1 voltage-gated potassium channel [Paenibacillus lactis]HAF97120.1 ion transporter [Paenibacillus lactis]
MSWWMWLLNLAGLIALIYAFYMMDKKWSSRPLLLAPLLIYVLVSVEDLLGWIDLMEIVPGKGGMRALIVIFSLCSVVFYVLYIFDKIADSVNRHVDMKTTLIRISMAAAMCILFFTLVYMSIYKLFGGVSFEGDNLGQDPLSQFITFLYFSMATFVTVGYGDVSPVDNTSRLVVILEIAFSFITVAYALSMLGTLRQIFKPGSDRPETYSTEEGEPGTAAPPHERKHFTR